MTVKVDLLHSTGLAILLEVEQLFFQQLLNLKIADFEAKRIKNSFVLNNRVMAFNTEMFI